MKTLWFSTEPILSRSPDHLRLGFSVFALLLASSSAFAWGPHTEITAAALKVVPDHERWVKYFGDDWQRIAKDYCWMGDWQEAVRPDHFADDYLLFPGATRHVSHMLPAVRQTYEPYFRRALQALRTEDARNAARWIGSLLHFVQDSGSPPHTTGVGGELHSRMERWVDESKIDIAGYRPRLLGKTDADALRGFQTRMDELIAFSKARALRLRPLLENVKERVNQPLELECALETARVSADLIHTLLTLGLVDAKEGCILEGSLNYESPRNYAKVPFKVVLTGTSFSTTADTTYRFRNLPEGKYDVWFLACGCEVEKSIGVVLRKGETVKLSPRLKREEIGENLVRNPRFQLRWIEPTQPDGWRPDPLRGGRWMSALVRVPLDKKCVIHVEFVPGKEVPVAVRWRANPSTATGGREKSPAFKKDTQGRFSAEVAPDLSLAPFEKGVLFLELLLDTKGDPADVCRHVAVIFKSEPKN